MRKRKGSPFASPQEGRLPIEPRNKGFFARHKWDAILIGAALLACLVGLLVYSLSRGAATNVARIYRQNDLILTLDLEKEGEERDLDVEGTHSPMVFTVKKGAIKVKYSGCPSQYCVHQGYHSGKDGPLVCAYNGVYVTFEGGAGGNVVVVG